MIKQEQQPPIIIKRHQSIQGYGCFASRTIEKGELISSYSGCVLPQKQIQQRKLSPQYIMSLIDGSSTSKAWSICPFLKSSFGIFFNCGIGKSINMETLMCLIDSHILVLMRAKMQIYKNQQLLYDYNGRLNEYETKQFQKL